MKSGANLTCVSRNGKSRALTVKNDTTMVQGSMCSEDDVLRENRIVEDCKQEKHVSVCVSDQTEVIPKLYESCRERGTQNNFPTCCKQKNFDLNWILETLKDASAYIRFFRKTCNKCLQKIDFENYLFLLKKCKEGIKCVQKLHGSGTQEANSDVCESGLLSVADAPRKQFKHPIKTAYFSLLETRNGRRIPRDGPQKVLWNDNGTSFAKFFFQVCPDMF